MSEEQHSQGPTPNDAQAALDRGERLYGEGDVDGAQRTFEEVEAAGDMRGALELAALFEDARQDPVAAELAWRRADEAGDLNGAGNVGRLLREKGDMLGAGQAFRRCVDRGSERAIGDWAGLLLRRPDASAEELAEAADLLCQAHDKFIWHQDMRGAVVGFCGGGAAGVTTRNPPLALIAAAIGG